MGDQTVRNMAVKGPSLETQSRYNQSYYATASTVSLLRAGLLIPAAISLVRPVAGSITQVAPGVASGVSSALGVVGAGYIAYLFFHEHRDYRESRRVLEQAKNGHHEASIGMSRWCIEMSGKHPGPVVDSPVAFVADRERSLQHALAVEKNRLNSSHIDKALRCGWLTFLRDCVIQLAGSGNAFARNVKLLFHGAHVSGAAVPIVGAAIGMVTGGLHITAAVRARRQAGATRTASTAVVEQIDVKQNALETCGEDLDLLANFLVKPGETPGELAFGKKPVSAAETRETAKAIKTSGTTTPGRKTKYDVHVAMARKNPDKVKKARHLTRDIFKRIQTKEKAACVKAEYETSVANKRIGFGVVSLVCSGVALVLSVTGVGTPASMVLSVVSQLILMASSTLWAGYASFRSGRWSSTGDGPDDAGTTTVDDIMALLQDRSEESTLARKLVKSTLRDQGLSREALKLMKIGNLHGDRMKDADFGNQATATVRELICELLAVGEKTPRDAVTGATVDFCGIPAVSCDGAA